jgi:hypothetical protein
VTEKNVCPPDNYLFPVLSVISYDNRGVAAIVGYFSDRIFFPFIALYKFLVNLMKPGNLAFLV